MGEFLADFLPGFIAWCGGFIAWRLACRRANYWKSQYLQLAREVHDLAKEPK